jgi:hypothetical protein
MLLVFNATPEAKKALDQLLQTGQFRDASETICVALTNYQALMSAAPKEAPQEIEIDDPDSLLQRANPPKPEMKPPPTSNPSVPEVPVEFSLRISSLDGLTLLPMPESRNAGVTDLPPSEWLFGQFNKPLAAKATCRALLNLLREKPIGIPVADASTRISSAACKLGDYLREVDRKLQTRREELFAAAFPSSEEHSAESRLRFGNQFVASLRQDKLEGFPAALKLVATDSARTPLLSLTKAGAEFAILQNPVLDAPAGPGTKKFSEPEIKFLLAHILSCVPEETSAFFAILDAIQKEANTPESIDKYLRERFQLRTEKAIKATFLTTQRTGVISRLADLGLISREKKGLRVTYLATKAGKEFLAQIIAA